LVLVASSSTLHRASLAARAGNDRGFRRWVLVTIVLGALFVANQVREWSALSFGPATHSFGSAFYVMTGFHGLHVIGGLLAMAVVLGTTRPAVTATGHAATEVVAAYWHFVDVVWIGLFAVLFLLR
jgi:cytochrome c oxidase subunit 3